MIKKITLKDDYICFVKNDSFEFKPITLLVGDQGCGKSTLLHLSKTLVESLKKKSWVKLEFDNTKQEKMLYLDLEKDNPMMNESDPNSSESVLYGLQSIMGSHGEAILPILKILNEVENTIIFLDEPETSLSLRSQYLMIKIFKDCLKRNNQLILSTHNLVFIEAFPDNIFSLEHMKYVTPKEFVKLEKNENNFKEIREDKKIKKSKCKMGIDCECTKDRPFYDRNCIHYIDRDGKSGYERRGDRPNKKMKKGDFKNG